MHPPHIGVGTGGRGGRGAGVRYLDILNTSLSGKERRRGGGVMFYINISIFCQIGPLSLSLSLCVCVCVCVYGKCVQEKHQDTHTHILDAQGKIIVAKRCTDCTLYNCCFCFCNLEPKKQGGIGSGEG